MAKKDLLISPQDVTIDKDAEGTLIVTALIQSTEHGTEGTFTFTLTADMALHLRWDGVGLSDFRAWSTQ